MNDIQTILKYKNAADLKRQIISQYLKGIQENAEQYKRILSDKKWASSNTPYHIEVRENANAIIEQAETQAALLILKNEAK